VLILLIVVEGFIAFTILILNNAIKMWVPIYMDRLTDIFSKYIFILIMNVLTLE